MSSNKHTLVAADFCHRSRISVPACFPLKGQKNRADELKECERHQFVELIQYSSWPAGTRQLVYREYYKSQEALRLAL